MPGAGAGGETREIPRLPVVCRHTCGVGDQPTHTEPLVSPQPHAGALAATTPNLHPTLAVKENNMSQVSAL